MTSFTLRCLAARNLGHPASFHFAMPLWNTLNVAEKVTSRRPAASHKGAAGYRWSHKEFSEILIVPSGAKARSLLIRPLGGTAEAVPYPLPFMQPGLDFRLG